METFIYTRRFHTPVYRTVMPSGAEVWTCPLASRMVSIETVFPFGAMEDGEHKGIAHFLEHLMLKGPDVDGIHPLLRPLIRKGCTQDATTGWFNTRFTQSGLAENLTEMLQAMSGILHVPAFTIDQVDRERGVILAEIEERKASERFRTWFYPKAYPEIFGAYVPIGGTQTSVKETDFVDLQAHAQKQFCFEQAQFIASGGVTHEEHLKQIRSLYPEVMNPGSKKPRRETLKYACPSGVFVLGNQSATTSINFYYQAPTDSLGEVHLGVGIQGLVGSPCGVLVEQLRNKRRLVYSVGTYGHAWPLTDVCFEIPVASKDFDAVQGIFHEVMKGIRENGLPNDVLDQVLVRRRIFFATRDEAFTRQAAINYMHRMWLEGDIEDLDYESLVLSTTPKQVHEACIKYLDPDKMGIVKCVRPDA